jgi:hypothetical protein
MHWIYIVFIGFLPPELRNIATEHPGPPRTPTVYSLPAIPVPSGAPMEYTTSIAVYPGGHTTVNTTSGRPPLTAPSDSGALKPSFKGK